MFLLYFKKRMGRSCIQTIYTD